MRILRIIGLCGWAALFAACTAPRVKHPEVETPIARKRFAQRLSRVHWQQLEGWQEDTLINVATALHENCLRVKQRSVWQRICTAAKELDTLDSVSTRAFFERHFTPFRLSNPDGTVEGLITGYYEPLVRGARVRRAPYVYPLYRWPPGMARGTALPARAALLRGTLLKGAELVYLDDPVEAFFLQVQGSGRIMMEDGSVMRVGFDGSNGHPYRSIGRWLIEQGELTHGQVTMQGIKAWGRARPQRIDELLNMNPRFIFFKEMPASEHAAADGPTGALGARLTAGRSIAVDPAAVPLGLPVFLSTRHPLSSAPLNRLVFAQDTGSAIKGAVRADYFWGSGDEAGRRAGRMSAPGRMWVLLPRE